MGTGTIAARGGFETALDKLLRFAHPPEMINGPKPGPLNLITDVPGLRVGHAHDEAVRSGVTVIVPDAAAVCACDVRGGGPGTRETDLLQSGMLVSAVDAIFLSGGSVYGLGAGDGVAAVLGDAGRGYARRPGVRTAPIVPGAILFDLGNGGDKQWGDDPPYRRLSQTALRAAAAPFALGAVGAGFGAMAGALKGGIGSASLIDREGLVVGAIAAVNSFGSAVMPNSKAFWASPYELNGEFGGVRPNQSGDLDPDDWGLAKEDPGLRENTTLCVVATNQSLSPSQAQRLAIMAQDGLARALRPVHAPFDGDVVFALSTGDPTLPGPTPTMLALLGERAANCVARAVARGVYEATAWAAGPRCWRDL